MAWVEIDTRCQKVLKKNFPGSIGFQDVKKISYATYKSILRNRNIRDRRIDIVSGGFPCQPYSVAGQRAGEDDDRALWPEMFRVIREFQPTWVVAENVPGLISMGLDQVLSDLESAGYACQTLIIPACAVNALHRRDRVWIVAYANGKRSGVSKGDKSSGQNGEYTRTLQPEAIRCKNGETYPKGIRADSFCHDTNQRRWQNGGYGEGTEEQKGQKHEHRYAIGGLDRPAIWQPDDMSDLLREAYGLPGRVDRNKRIKALGNAIVPQIAFEIFKAIAIAESQL